MEEELAVRYININNRLPNAITDATGNTHKTCEWTKDLKQETAKETKSTTCVKDFYVKWLPPEVTNMPDWRINKNIHTISLHLPETVVLLEKYLNALLEPTNELHSTSLVLFLRRLSNVQCFHWNYSQFWEQDNCLKRKYMAKILL